MAFNAVTIRIVRGRDPLPNSGSSDDSDISVDLKTSIQSYQQCADLVAKFAEIIPCSVDFKFSPNSIEIAIAMNLGSDEQEELQDVIAKVFRIPPSDIHIKALGWA